MPLNIPNNLPAYEALKNENIFAMKQDEAARQDIRPLQIAILNLMPIKIETELHLLRLLGNTPLQIEITLLHMQSHDSTNTPKEHLEQFYSTFKDVKTRCFDGMIVTGAPVELLDFEQVDYWEEMKAVMDWATKHVTSTMYICWAAQAGLYHLHGVPKHVLNHKIFGVFSHKIHNTKLPLVRGFDDEFLAPHSRYSTCDRNDILKVKELEIIAESDDAGVYIAAEKNGKSIFVTGHSEYDPCTLKKEYDRDVTKGQKIVIPKNYFPNDDPTKTPIVRWTSHAHLLFSNWLNYYVYQATSFDWTKKEMKE